MAATEIVVGVPEIIPVTGSKFNPAGSAGLTEYEVGVPPPDEGVLSAIAVPTQYDGVFTV